MFTTTEQFIGAPDGDSMDKPWSVPCGQTLWTPMGSDSPERERRPQADE